MLHRCSIPTIASEGATIRPQARRPSLPKTSNTKDTVSVDSRRRKGMSRKS